MKLLVLSGSPTKLSERFRRLSSRDTLSVTRLDEKSLVEAGRILAEIRDRKYIAVAFGCRSFETLRYEFVISAFLLCARAQLRYIVDESGRSKEVRLPSYLLQDIPRFAAETIASVFVVVLTFVRLLVLKKRMKYGGRKRV